MEQKDKTYYLSWVGGFAGAVNYERSTDYTVFGGGSVGRFQ